MEQLPLDDIPQEVVTIMILCGLSDAVPDPNPNGVASPAERIAAGTFLDDFGQCLEMTYEKLVEDLRSYARSPENPIHVDPLVRNKIHGFIEWAKHCYRCGFDPQTTVFPVENSREFVSIGRIHAKFVTDGEKMASSAKPNVFKASDNWATWSPLLVNYLRLIPGCDGVPLSYVIRDEDEPTYDPEITDIQALYEKTAPLEGVSFIRDTDKVHSIINGLIAGNQRAMLAIQKFKKTDKCGRKDWTALKLLYEGTGAFSTAKVKASEILKSLFYTGEKNKDYCWENFESQLLYAFSVFAFNAGPGVIPHDEEMKLKILLEKTQSAQNLRDIATAIERDLSRPNFAGTTFDSALDEMRNRVRKTATGTFTTTHNRRIQNANSARNDRQHHPYSDNRAGRGGGGRGNGGRGNGQGRGGFGRGGRGRGRGSGNGVNVNKPRNHPDAYNIRLLNGQTLSVHPSYGFSDDELSNMHPNDRQAIFQKRAEYRQRRQVSATSTAPSANEYTIQVPVGADTATIVSALTTQMNQQQVNNDTMTIRVSQASTMMGGRNEQAAQRRQISYFYSTRNVNTDSRQISSARHVSPPSNVSANNECDSNADTCCAGTNFVILQYTNRTANVYPYDASYAPITNVPIVSAATAYTHPDTDAQEERNLTVSSSRYAKGRTPLEIITGDTPDISEYIDFAFYDFVVYRSNAGLGPNSLGRWLGVSHRIGKLMSYWILPESGQPISCTTVQRLTNLEMQTIEWQARMRDYEDKIKEKMKTTVPIQIPSNIPEDCTLGLLEYESVAFLDDFYRVIDDPEVPHGKDDEIKDPNDEAYRDMRLTMKRTRDGKQIAARIRGRATDEDGTPLGTGNENPLLDMRQYVVDYIDGDSEVVTANIIAENLLSQVDDHGFGQRQLEEIVDHRTTDDAVPKHEGWITHGSNRRRRITTKGWEILVRWADGTDDWIALKDLKNSYPVELAEYAVSKKIQDMPAFAYWVPHVLKKREIIISKLKTKYWDRTHKYGIKIPKTLKEALQFDRENNNTLWWDAIKKEMKNVRIAFEAFDGDIADLDKKGFERITCHIIFDVKLSEGFRRKARFVADGHKVETPPSVSYSSVVSRDSVRICLMLAALNDLSVLCVDIQNAYLTAPNRERVYMKAGPEFGDEEGQWMIIVRALYGLRGAGASFRAHLASKLDEMGFAPSVADPDVWMRAGIKPDGTEYYEYILCYVDDILCVSDDPMKALKELGEFFQFKNDEIAEPRMYLGATLKQRTLNDKKRWSITSDEYLKAAVENLEKQLDEKGFNLPAALQTPTNNAVVFETDDSRELDADEIVHYQELIGILRWATELGRVDILLEVSLLSSFSAMPRWTHLQQVYLIFAFLKKNPKFSLYMSPEHPVYDAVPMQRNHDDFKEHYRDAKEELPARMPRPRGKSVVISAFVDASHAGNKVTRQSHTGVQIFVNRALVMWYSKKQPTVESSAFASEFVAMKVCIEMVVALRFKLRMLGVPLDDEPSKIFCDNQAVALNSSELASTLSKKHNSLAYHLTRWHVAAGIIQVFWIPTDHNLADTFTKRLSKLKRDTLFGNIAYY